jgi:alanyl-tRNA synthetase
MTGRLYYRDPSLFEFDANVVRAAPEGKGFAVVLDRTCFYPGGGGQPADKGSIGGVPVTGMREEGEDIVHLLSALPPKGVVHGKVDAAWRLDFMAQHTGQHILSHSLLDAAGCQTVSVHFGEETVTVEIEARELDDAKIRDVEDMANRIVKENRRVLIHETDAEGASRFPLRRKPPNEPWLRIVEVEGFDWAACSGVHVATTGEIFLIKILSIEKIRGRLRVHAAIGKRAMDDYRRKNTLAQGLGKLFTCGDAEILRKAEELAARVKEQAGELRKLRAEKAKAAAAEALKEGRRAGDRLFVSRAFDGIGPEGLKAFLEDAASVQGVFAASVDRTQEGFQWAVTHSLGNGVDLTAFMAPILSGFEARGGGKPDRMQGSAANPARAEEFLQRIEEELAKGKP